MGKTIDEIVGEIPPEQREAVRDALTAKINDSGVGGAHTDGGGHGAGDPPPKPTPPTVGG